jgi:WD40 repeat protein
LIARGQPPKVRAKPQPKPDPPDHTTATRIGPAPSPLVGGIGSIAISRDGKAFVIGANTRGEGVPLCLYDVATRKQIRRFGTDTYERGMVCLSPDGKTLAHWSHYHLEFWDIDTGVQNWRLPGPHGDPTALAFSPDGKLLATAYMAGQSDFAPIQLWDVARGRELEPLVGHKRTVHALAFTPDGRLVSFGDAFADSGRKAESTVAVWNVQTSKLLKRVDHFFAGAGCCLSPYGSLLLTQDDGKLQISSSLNEKVRRTLPAVNFHSHAVFSPDGKQLATSGDRDPINLWDPATGKKTRSFADGLSARDVLGFSADGKILASAGVAGFSLGPNRVRIWEVDTGNEVHVPPGHTGRVTAAVHSPDAKLLASADADGVIHLWELPGGQQRAALPGLKASSIEALAFTLDGRTLVAASNERVASWDLAKADSPSVWTLDKKKNEHLTLSRDGKTLVTVDDAGNVACWNIPSGKPFLKLQIPTRVRSMALSPAGDVLAIGTDAGSDDLVQLWSLPTGRPLPSVSPGKRDADYVHLTFSPDGRFLATSDIFPHSSAARLRLWEVTSGQPICTVTGMDLIPMVFAFTPDSSALLYTCWKQREWLGQRGAILRDLSTFKDLKQITGGEFEGVCLTSGRALKPLHGHTGAISVVSFAPDGKSVVTGGTDGSLLSWPTAPHRQTLPREPGPVDAAKLWSDLSKEAGAAYRAIARLQADPAEAVRVARRELRPAAFPDAAEVDRWIGELNHPNFVVRGRANESLEKLGEVIEPALRKAAEKPASVEQGRRLQALLDKAGQAHRRPENLAALRAIGLLERIATPEARALLRTLADGAPAARSTQDAKAALKRMGG